MQRVMHASRLLAYQGWNGCWTEIIAVSNETGMADEQKAGHSHSKQYHWLLQQWQAQHQA
jgi:hypothetical protein